jgi:hypothetical protein
MLMPKRYCKVEVKDATGASTVFENKNSIGARIEFSVVNKTQTFQHGFNTAQIRIYNLTNERFDYLRQSGKEVSLTVGTDNLNDNPNFENPFTNRGIIFNGYIYNVARTKEDTDIVTILYCSSMNNTSANLNLVLSQTFENITLNKLLDTIATDTGLAITRDNFTGVSIASRSYFNEYKIVLNQLALKYGFTWSLNNKTLIVRKRGSTDVQVFEFSADSGLLKPPILTEKGVDIEVFLQPNIKPQDQFQLNSKFGSFKLGALEFQERITAPTSIAYLRTQVNGRYTGTYTALFITHDGSTHTNQWVTRIEGWFNPNE